eukprot:c19188_g1_i1 orf=55-228(+)
MQPENAHTAVTYHKEKGQAASQQNAITINQTAVNSIPQSKIEARGNKLKTRKPVINC